MDCPNVDSLTMKVTGSVTQSHHCSAAPATGPSVEIATGVPREQLGGGTHFISRPKLTRSVATQATGWLFPKAQMSALLRGVLISRKRPRFHSQTIGLRPVDRERACTEQSKPSPKKDMGFVRSYPASRFCCGRQKSFTNRPIDFRCC